jgi:uncharacterized membrane protein YidH (DUF202 family)
MSVLSVIGLVILVVGVFLIGAGLQKTQTLTNKVVEGITGRYTQKTIWILIGGALLILIGGILMYTGWVPPVNPHP